MAKETFTFDQFLNAVDANYRPFVQDLHDFLRENGCKISVEEKKSGFFASCKDPKTKRSMINLLFRKVGLLIRIYGENAHTYQHFLATLPPDMIQSIENANPCKRLINPEDCSPTCPKGYDFKIGTKRHQICRYGAFEFPIIPTAMPYIKSFVEYEVQARRNQLRQCQKAST